MTSIIDRNKKKKTEKIFRRSLEAKSISEKKPPRLTEWHQKLNLFEYLAITRSVINN